MPCTEAYKERIMYTFNGFCKTVIRFAAINAWRDRSRRRQKEISLEYLTEEKQAIFETHHEPIIDRDTWERVQELRKQHKRRGKLRRQEIEIYYSFVGKVELPD